MVKNEYYGNVGLSLAWDIGVIFLGVPDCAICDFWFFYFFKFKPYGKMWRLFPCIPIFFRVSLIKQVVTKWVWVW